MKLHNSMIRSAALIAAVSTASAADVQFSPRAERWGVQEVMLKTSKTYFNPFTQVQLRCRFRSGDAQIEAEGFYDGDQTWKVRLMPTVEGKWTFETVSDDAELNGAKGEFEVGAPRPGNHGPVVTRNTYHFAFSDGTTYFPLGTTLYNWLHREEALQQRTLATLEKSPFNKVRFCVFPKWYPFNREEPSLYPYTNTPDGQFALDRFNPEYFRHIERRLRDLQAVEIEADVILFHPYDRWGFATMDQAQDDAYLYYVIARLASFRNVWWTMANEWDLIKPPKDWDHIFQMVRDLDPYNHLRANHNMRVWYDHSKPWVTHCNIQEQRGDHYQVSLDARRKYGKPVLVDEYGYEGNNGRGWGNLSGYEEVRRHWMITMAGGYASHGETYVHPGNILWWAVGGTLVGQSPPRLGFLKKVMAALPYEEMEPAPETATRGFALAKKGSCYLFYLADNQQVEVTIEGGGPFQVELIDPWLMETYPLSTIDSGTHVFRPAFVPSLLRVTKVGPAVAGAGSLATIEQLLTNWGGER